MLHGKEKAARFLQKAETGGASFIYHFYGYGTHPAYHA